MIETILKTSLDSATVAGKIVVDNLIKDEKFAETCTKFLDAQNENAKKTVDTTCEFGREFYMKASSPEFYSAATKNMQDSMKTFMGFFNKN